MGVDVYGLNSKTTIQELVAHINSNSKAGNIKITDVEMKKNTCWVYSFVRIHCSKYGDAQKLVKVLNLSKVKGSKLVAQALLLGNLKDDHDESRKKINYRKSRKKKGGKALSKDALGKLIKSVKMSKLM